MVPPTRSALKKPGSREAKTHLKVKISIKDLALMIIYAALYAALVYVAIPISYGIAQFRIAGALRPAISKKWILAIGYGFGVLAANLFSPFAGPWDLVFMPLMSVVAGFAGYLIAKPFKQNYFVSGAVTAAIIAVSLSFMFEQFGLAPMYITLLPLLVIEQIVCLIGATVFQLIDRRFKWWQT